jgi:hypothetical protein
MTDGSSAARVPQDERRRAQVSPRLALAMMVAGLGGTGYFGATSVSAQRESAISRDEATRITAQRNRYEDLLQRCQERESDRMNHRLDQLESRR